MLIITDIASSHSQSFLCTSEDKCLVCGQDLNDDASTISKRGWDTRAEEWSKIKLPLSQEYYMFTRVHNKLVNILNHLGEDIRKTLTIGLLLVEKISAIP